MRPLDLRIEGFTCFRDPQEVDFSDLELFVIAGATGSGKTSLLDAMVFALFGAVPRVGQSNVKEFISAGADRMSVRLDFEMEQQHYRVTRVAFRSARGTIAQLERVLPDRVQPMEDGVRPVQKKIEEIVGLDYDAFVQSVLLPQGQFAKFMKEAPAGRRKTLTRLLRLEVYERMMKKARNEATTLAAQITSAEQMLEREYAGATETAAKKAQADAEAQERSMEDARADLAQKELEAANLKQALAQWSKIRIVERTLAHLEQQQAAVEDDRRRFEAADRAEPVRSWIGAIADLVPESAEATRLAGEASHAKGVAEEKMRAAEQALESALRAAKALPDLEERRELLGGVGALVVRRKAMRDLFAKSEAEVLASRASTISDEDFERLRNADSRGSLLGARRHDLAERQRALAQSKAALQPKRDDAEVAERGLATAKEALSAAAEAVQAARDALDGASYGNSAMLLREHLEPGGPCPVCNQLVSTVPAVRLPADLERLRDALRAAESAKGDAGQGRDEASSVREQTRAQLEAAKEAVSKTKLAVDDLAAAVSAEGASLKGEFGSLLDDKLPEVALKNALVAAARARWHACNDQIRAAAGDSDPQVELARVERHIAQLNEGLKAAREAVASTTEAFDKAERLHGTRKQDARAKARQLRDADAKARALAEESGFATAVEAEDALLQPEERRALRERVAQWTTDHSSAKRRLTELPEPDRKADEDDVRSAAQAAMSAKERAESAALAAVEARLRSNALVEKSLRAAELRKALGEKKAKERLHRELAGLLQSNKFQAHLLNRTFRDLVAGASHRLHELTGRYSMVYTDDQFVVIDHDNAQERRIAQTLSGGETFMASLCLALQLSEQIQAAKGTVKLDSLFIDEGFGTLDDETLDTVTDALQSLGEGRRMVGLITHVKELTDRMPARIRVTRSGGVSQLTVEREN